MAGRLTEAAWFVELAPVTDPAEVPYAVLDMLGIRGPVISRRAGEPGAAPLDRLAAALTGPFVIEGHVLHLGASIGQAVFPIDADDADGLLRSADAAMFAVKRGAPARALGR